MGSQRIAIGLSVMMLMLAGCYRQAEGSFESVQSQNAAAVPDTPVPASPTPTLIVIEPNASPTVAAEPSETPAAPVSPSAAFIPFDEPTAILEATVIVPPETVIPLQAPTEIVPPETVIPLQAPTNAPLLVPTATEFVFAAPTTLSTSTPVGIITPQAASAVEFPTFTLEPSATVGGVQAGLITPTALPGQTSSECTYTVKSGDNLFRIAINNNVDLDALRAANSIVGDLIQPGDVLTLPGCTPAESSAPDGTGGSTQTDTAASGRTHTVAAGETVAIIARQYNISITELVRANNLPNPNLLSIGQVLNIPAVP